MADSYDMRSNIKGKPGSQGTLFQVKDKGLLNPEQRWPRGYTPERQEQVRNVLKNVRVTGGPRVKASPEEQARTGLSASFPSARARVTDAVARSTVPTKDLYGLQAISSTPQEGHRATYWPNKREIGIDMHAGPEKDEELIHEIGHHVDRTQTKQSSRLGPAAVSSGEYEGHDGGKVLYGVSEGIADNYAVEHHRSRRGKNAPQAGLYERIQGAQGIEERYPGYRAARPLNPSQFEGHDPHQGSLF